MGKLKNKHIEDEQFINEDWPTYAPISTVIGCVDNKTCIITGENGESGLMFSLLFGHMYKNFPNLLDASQRLLKQLKPHEELLNGDVRELLRTLQLEVDMSSLVKMEN